MPGPITYICARYPTVSHTFVLREVEALRRIGLDVRPVSVRRVGSDQLIGAREEAEAARTANLLPASAPRLLLALAGLLRADGARALGRAAARAWELRRPGLRGTLWQLFYLAEAILLWRECRRSGSRHIHAHFANVAADVALLTCVLGARRGWSWSFTMHGPGDLWDVSALRLADKAADASFVSCISDFARSQLMALTAPEVWRRLHVVHCGIEDEHLAKTGPEGPDGAGPKGPDLAWPEGPDGAGPKGPGRAGPEGPPPASAVPRLVNIGRLAAAKGQTLLLELAADLKRSGTPFELLIVGEGPLRGRLEAEIAARGLGDVVRLTGALSQEEVARLHRTASVFVLPSFAEGVPVVAMEAMAAGVPVVATRVAGVAELIEDCRTGRLVPPGRTDLLIAAVRELLEDPERRAALGRAARERVAGDFHVDREARKIAELFAETAS